MCCLGCDARWQESQAKRKSRETFRSQGTYFVFVGVLERDASQKTSLWPGDAGDEAGVFVFIIFFLGEKRKIEKLDGETCWL